MIFERENLSFHILDVFELNQQECKSFNKARHFHALSFRLHADAILKTKTNTFQATDNCVAYVPANVDYERICKYDTLIALHFELNDYHANDIQILQAKNTEKLRELFLEIAKHWKNKEVGYQHKCSALLYEIFEICYKETYNPSRKNSKIRNSVAFLEANFKNPDLAMEEIAKQSFISAVHFRKLFKEEYGLSPQKYIIRLRIQNAAALISSGSYTLQEVAYLSGYNDYKYFSVEFKKIYGFSPSKYEQKRLDFI